MEINLIAECLNNGDWDIIEQFEAQDDQEANAYAEEHHSDLDWYILNNDGQNINGGGLA